MRDKDLINELQVLNLNGVGKVSSLVVAEKFGKRHDNVLRSIQQMEMDKEFALLNFEESKYRYKDNRLMPIYYMTKDGFILLVMGFKGKKAMDLKVKYIKAFNAMFEMIKSKVISEDETMLDWTTARIEGKKIRRRLTDFIRDFYVPAAEDQGSKNSNKLYLVCTKILNNQFIDDPENPLPRGTSRRDCLTSWDLAMVGEVEQVMIRTIEEELERGTHYKDINKIMKKIVGVIAETFGKRCPQLPEKKIPSLPGKTINQPLLFSEEVG